MKFLKLLISIILFPLVISLISILLDILTKSISANFKLDNFLWFIGGCSFYFFLFLTTPKPYKIYVLGHELTHAIWAILMGKKVSKIKISKKGGYVEISKSNFWISLSPYFFPFYTFVLILLSLFLYFFNYNNFYTIFFISY